MVARETMLFNYQIVAVRQHLFIYFLFNRDYKQFRSIGTYRTDYSLHQEGAKRLRERPTDGKRRDYM